MEPISMEVSITNSKELKCAIDKAIVGDRIILFSIGKYIAYNYYMSFHVKEGSANNLANEKIYSSFKQDYPKLYEQVEGWVTFNFNKWSSKMDD